MNWVHSAAARAGLGPPEWLVIAIILAVLFAGCLEFGRSDSSTQAVLLTRKEKWAVTVLVALIAMLISVSVWRGLAG